LGGNTSAIDKSRDDDIGINDDVLHRERLLFQR
jgi:hypothetical protein